MSSQGPYKEKIEGWEAGDVKTEARDWNNVRKETCKSRNAGSLLEATKGNKQIFPLINSEEMSGLNLNLKLLTSQMKEEQFVLL